MIKRLFFLLCFLQAALPPAHANRIANRSAGGSSYDSDAQDYFNRIAAAGSSISDPQKTVFNDFVVGLKADGTWSHQIEMNGYGGTSVAGYLVKLKYTSAIAPGTNSNSGFDSGDFSAGGLQGDSTNRLGTGVTVAEVGSNIGLSFYLNQQLPTPGIAGLIGSSLSFDDGDRSLLFYLDVFYARFSDDQAAMLSPQAWPLGRGLIHVEKSGNTTTKLYINGTLVSTDATSASITNSNEIGVYAVGNAATFPNNLLGAFYSIDDGTMSDAEAMSFAGRVRDLVWGLGRVTPTQPMRFFLWVGQSLALGWGATPAISTTADTNNNLMPTTGTAGNSGGTDSQVIMGSFAPIREPVSGGLETPAAGFASLTSNTAHAIYGIGGTAYSGLKKGTSKYNDSIAGLVRAKALSREHATSFSVPAILAVHGEADNQSTTYATDLQEWLDDYQADLRTAGVIGPSDTLMLFNSQIASWSQTYFGGGPGFATHNSSTAMLEASAADSRIIVVCPKYFLEHNSTDGTHLTAASSKLLGQYYAKAFKQVFEDMTPWENFAPTNISRTGNVVTLTFPRTDLEFDTTAVAALPDGNYGFEWSGGGVTISSVAIGGPSDSQVIITLSGTPTGGGYEIRYAYTATNTTGANTGANLTHGPRGNVRTADPGDGLPEWMLIFKEPVSMHEADAMLRRALGDEMNRRELALAA